ncbi:putative ABC transporter ATP-binding protein [Mycobacterium tuberculosis]|nr:putative ABC transporter ATP-binding protein [Mycobacterium tuberculosis]
MERLDKPLGDLKRASFSFEAETPSGREVLDVRGIAVSYDGQNPLIRNVSFQLRRGDTAALIGPNGIGKSTLLKTLIGQHTPDRGTYDWGTNVKIGYYDQEQTGLNPHQTVLEELWSAYPHLEEARIRTVLGNFLFSGEDVFKKVGSLSGGEKARVALAKLMLQKANVLILDEPTNHLDLYSKEVLESALIDYEGTLLFISHDRYFLNKMAESILELTPDGVTGYLGNYDDYVEKKLELAEIEQQRREAEEAKGKAEKTGASASAGPSDAAATEAKGSGYEAGKQAKREERSRQRKLEQLEELIARLEGELGELESELALPEVYNNYVLVQEKNSLMEEKRARLSAAYEQWEELAE